MEVLSLLDPVDLAALDAGIAFAPFTWRRGVRFYQQDPKAIQTCSIALIGVVGNDTDDQTALVCRQHLYALSQLELVDVVVDLGNYKCLYQPKDYEAIGFLCSELIGRGITPVFINGRQSLTYSMYLGFSYLRSYASLICYDGRLDFSPIERPRIDEGNWINSMLLHKPNYLFNYSLIGYQGYLVDPAQLQFFDSLNFDMVRLGEIRTSPLDYEPMLRNAHIGSWDMACIRAADAPDSFEPGPNGFYAEEACLQSRYCGFSTSMRAVGFFNYTTQTSKHTAHLAAQMIWHFIEGFHLRQLESPEEDSNEFTKYIVLLDKGKHTLHFYKSNKTDRWWMEISLPDGSPLYTPCSESDYQKAANNELPDRWIQVMRKFG